MPDVDNCSPYTFLGKHINTLTHACMHEHILTHTKKKINPRIYLSHTISKIFKVLGWERDDGEHDINSVLYIKFSKYK